MQQKNRAGRKTGRKGRKTRRNAISRFFVTGTIFCVMAFAAFVAFREFRPSSVKTSGQGTAAQEQQAAEGQGTAAQEPQAAEGQGTAAQEQQAAEGRETAMQELLQKPEGIGTFQQREGQGSSPAGKEGQGTAQQALSVSDVHAMAAGSILDISGLPQQTLDSFFYSAELSGEVQQRISGSSYQENSNISLAELRYLRVLHIGFDGKTHIGELIVNQSIAEDILEIMSQLYAQSYPIEKMLLVDAYGADDERSMSDNNTSAFNYREIAGSSKLSKHALGLAIDINPLYNPYVKDSGTGELQVSPANGASYADRGQEFPYKIAEGDLCLQLFEGYGFTWGGNWNSAKDYQHFEK